MDRAKETLEDARILANAGRWNACVNRLYYACFYAVSAILVRHGLSSSKHTGVRSLFNRHYVKTGKVPKDLARIYNDLFERRQEGDYIDFVRFQESQVLPWISNAEQLIEHIARLVEKGTT
ncbi:MAG: HEPN domain-containing protein [Deltaproteobacteria bacterium]|nr:HEPN domain-containing protein [Deltaproteobacteria bacterium]